MPLAQGRPTRATAQIQNCRKETSAKSIEKENKHPHYIYAGIKYLHNIKGYGKYTPPTYITVWRQIYDHTCERPPIPLKDR